MRKFWRPESQAGVPGARPPGRGRRWIWPRAGAAVLALTAALGLMTAASWGATAHAATTLQVTTTSLPGASAGNNYNVQLTAAGGTAPYTWTVVDGSLPLGLELTPGGEILGSPGGPQSGAVTFTVQVTDSGSPAQTATQQLTLTEYGKPDFTYLTVPDATAGDAYSEQLTESGGESPYTWTQVGGQLPPGLTLSAGGVVSGTPTQAGTFTFSPKVTDSESPPQGAVTPVSITVAADKADLAATVTGPASAKPGAAVTDTVTVTDKGPAAASKVTVDLGTTGLTGVKPSAGGSTKSVTVLGITLSATTWSLASLAPGQQVTFTVTGTVPAKGVKTASAAGLVLSSTSDPDLLNNASATTTKITG